MPIPYFQWSAFYCSWSSRNSSCYPSDACRSYLQLSFAFPNAIPACPGNVSKLLLCSLMLLSPLVYCLLAAEFHHEFSGWYMNLISWVLGQTVPMLGECPLTSLLSCGPLPIIAAFSGVIPPNPQICFPKVHGLYATAHLSLCPQGLEFPYVIVITTEAASDFYILNWYFTASESQMYLAVHQPRLACPVPILRRYSL